MLTTCARCKHIIHKGITRAEDTEDPPEAALCLACWGEGPPADDA